MSSKRIEIFEKTSNSLKISLKSLVAIAVMASPPLNISFGQKKS
jgi:hypothetical protein